jgi:hypothetical protein
MYVMLWCAKPSLCISCQEIETTLLLLLFHHICTAARKALPRTKAMAAFRNSSLTKQRIKQLGDRLPHGCLFMQVQCSPA